MITEIFSRLAASSSPFYRGLCVHGHLLSPRFYNAAVKTISISKECFDSKNSTKTPRQYIPTVKEINTSEQLQKEFAKMYQEQADDPEFKKVTKEVTEIARRLRVKE